MGVGIIEKNKPIVLKVLAERPRDGGGYGWISAKQLQEATRLSPNEINDVVTILQERGMVQLQKWFGTAPFLFGSVRISPRGRYEWECQTSVDPINAEIKRLRDEGQEDRWPTVVLELVKGFGESAVETISNAIRNDPVQTDVANKVTTMNSRKWNTVALAYVQVGLIDSALQLFQELIRREPDNAATLNNFGVALLKAGNLVEAKKCFEKAYESDKKVGVDQAQNLPAYRNLQLLEKEPDPKAVSKSELIRRSGPEAPSQHNILFMDIVGFSRPEWYGTIQVEKITFLIRTVQEILGKLGYEVKDVPMLHTGDGMALFLDRCEATIELAIELTKRLDAYNESQGTHILELRIGIHNGYSFPVRDLHGGGNRCGPAINTARRVLDLGEPRHILCTSDFKKNLWELYGPKYGSFIHDCGRYVVKHGEEIALFNIYHEHFGKPECPPKDS